MGREVVLVLNELGKSNQVTTGTNFVEPWTALSLPDFYEALTCLMMVFGDEAFSR